MLRRNANSMAKSDNSPLNQLTTSQYYEAEELVNAILDEAPDAIEPFNTREEMVEYVLEAMESDYIYCTELANHKRSESETSKGTRIETSP